MAGDNIGPVLTGAGHRPFRSVRRAGGRTTVYLVVGGPGNAGKVYRSTCPGRPFDLRRAPESKSIPAFMESVRNGSIVILFLYFNAL